MKPFDPKAVGLTKYIFFTGKGGVGKTSIACATAATLADNGGRVLLISTDPASNLQDVFNTELTGEGRPIDAVPGLSVANLDPLQAAADYRESVIAPYRGKLPESVLANMEEQLSGSCTVEIAAFNEFTNFIADKRIQDDYDYIIFDTAPTGHTLRMLQLPSAWSNFISENTHGASCLGQLSGLESKRETYKKAMETLSNGDLTTLVLVARPERTPFEEAVRSSKELANLGINNQALIINGLLAEFDDPLSEKMYNKQQEALSAMPGKLAEIPVYFVPLRAYNVTGVENIRKMLVKDDLSAEQTGLSVSNIPKLTRVIDDLHETGKRLIFTMGKGGVGKTTVAAAIALGLAAKGRKVHLATTDPAAHLKFVIDENSGVTTSHIDEEAELNRYREEVLSKARETMNEDDVAYIEEDLRSPCTREIAVFRAFAELVEKAEFETVVIDTAPTGHTLLLLDSTQNYHREVKRTKGDIPDSVKNLLPRLRNSDETGVVIVTLAEPTPVHEAMRLREDLERAGITAKWWVVNSSLYDVETTNKLLKSKAGREIEWINRIENISRGNMAVIKWDAGEISGQRLLNM